MHMSANFDFLLLLCQFVFIFIKGIKNLLAVLYREITHLEIGRTREELRDIARRCAPLPLLLCSAYPHVLYFSFIPSINM